MLKKTLAIFALSFAATTFAFAEDETNVDEATTEATEETTTDAVPELACEKCPNKCPVRK